MFQRIYKLRSVIYVRIYVMLVCQKLFIYVFRQPDCEQQCERVLRPQATVALERNINNECKQEWSAEMCPCVCVENHNSEMKIYAIVIYKATRGRKS